MYSTSLYLFLKLLNKLDIITENVKCSSSFLYTERLYIYIYKYTFIYRYIFIHVHIVIAPLSAAFGKIPGIDFQNTICKKK